MVRWFAVNSEDNAVDERDYFGAFRFVVFQKPFGRVNVGCRGELSGGGPPHGTESESSSE
jgi:hypothetical protein